MAAYGEDLGCQIFVTLRRGDAWPPTTCDVRVRYEQTLADLRAAVAAKLGVPPEHQLLFRHGRQLAPEDDGKTLLLLDMHTGFALQGYDTRVAPVFWPPVAKGDDGLLRVAVEAR